MSYILQILMGSVARPRIEQRREITTDFVPGWFSSILSLVRKIGGALDFEAKIRVGNI